VSPLLSHLHLPRDTIWDQGTAVDLLSALTSLPSPALGCDTGSGELIPPLLIRRLASLSQLKQLQLYDTTFWAVPHLSCLPV
jgi:hypothetical protein